MHLCNGVFSEMRDYFLVVLLILTIYLANLPMTSVQWRFPVRPMPSTPQTFHKFPSETGPTAL